jgi:hypothetical protein
MRHYTKNLKKRKITRKKKNKSKKRGGAGMNDRSFFNGVFSQSSQGQSSQEFKLNFSKIPTNQQAAEAENRKKEYNSQRKEDIQSNIKFNMAELERRTPRIKLAKICRDIINSHRLYTKNINQMCIYSIIGHNQLSHNPADFVNNNELGMCYVYNSGTKFGCQTLGAIDKVGVEKAIGDTMRNYNSHGAKIQNVFLPSKKGISNLSNFNFDFNFKVPDNDGFTYVTGIYRSSPIILDDIMIQRVLRNEDEDFPEYLFNNINLEERNLVRDINRNYTMSDILEIINEDKNKMPGHTHTFFLGWIDTCRGSGPPLVMGSTGTGTRQTVSLTQPSFNDSNLMLDLHEELPRN